jgi:hypothetical protein
MPGLWHAVRDAAFATLAQELGRMSPTDDPVTDLMATGSAYVTNALTHLDLYLSCSMREVAWIIPTAPHTPGSVTIRSPPAVLSWGSCRFGHNPHDDWRFRSDTGAGTPRCGDYGGRGGQISAVSG